MFGKRFAFIALASLGVFLSGCQVDGEDPLGPVVKPTPIDSALVHTFPIGQPQTLQGTPHGFLHAGETGSHLIIHDFGTNGVHIGINPWETTSWEFVLDANVNATLSVRGEYSYASTGSYLDMKQSVSLNVVNLETVGSWVYDTVWRCQTWALDSSSTDIHIYNALAGSACSTTPQFESIESRMKPQLYPAGQMIDASLAWGVVNGGHFYDSHGLNYPGTLPNGATYMRSELHRFEFWTSGAMQFLPLRFWDHNRFRYGYAKLAAWSTGVTVYAVVYEQ